MKRNVVSAEPDMTVREAAALLIEKRVGTLPVVDEVGTLVGVISIGDIIQIFLKARGLSVADIVRESVVVEDNCALIRALSVMEKHNLRDLLVVKEGKLVGIASRVDIGRAFLSSWLISQADEPEAH
jgi:CBS domain-containing protein